MAIKTIRWTPDCGCAVVYTCDDAVPLDEIVTKDVAYTPCAIHDPVRAGTTLLADDISPLDESRVRAALSADAEEAKKQGITLKQKTTTLRVGFRRPDKVRGNVPMPETEALRAEAHLKEDAKSVLINMPEFGRDGERGREFIVDPVITYDKERKIAIELPGASAPARARAAAAIEAAANARGDSRLKLLVSVKR